MQLLANNKKCFPSFLLPPGYIVLAHLAQLEGVICLLAECVGRGSEQDSSVHFLLCCMSYLYPTILRAKKIALCASSLGLSLWEKKKKIHCFLLIWAYESFSLNVLCCVFEAH